ncbi:ABC transporter permease [Rhabdothermincola salaria]|uniref:ABC transporter permease n=1 Tax=Rhabdothermincola salaria TaxID=2903142 RepID=UPI001E40A737|nr:hypothetical protein [Rhabdothermincola salaria]MCD9622876.1 hypothetical protein [Rhabdothermincola salaria]
MADVDTRTTAARPGPAATAPGHTLVGTWAMVRATLRQDRVKLPGWIAGFALFALYVGVAVPVAYPTETDLQSALGLLADPMGRLLTGPGYGFDDVSYERVVANGYGLYLMLMAAIMSILSVTRHTRLEEQTGRYELVRSAVVGRHAPLAATLVVTAGANLVAGLAIAATLVAAAGFGLAGSTLTGASVAAVGLAFTGVASMTAQVTRYARTASGLAGIVLGASFVLRAVGDMGRAGGGTLSWLSPLGWGQQSAPFVLDRWWPLALPLAFGAATTIAGVTLSAHRDLGSGLLAGRPGPPTASRALTGSLGLAVRLQRAAILGWTAALAVSGALFGAFTDAMGETAGDMPEVFRDVFGSDEMIDGYLAYMAVFMAYLAAVYAVAAVHAWRGEETGGRVTPVLATPVSRWSWLGANLLVTAAGVVLAMVATGVATGFGAALVTGEWSSVGEMTVAHLVQVPGVLVVLGLAVACFGWLPRAVPAVWGLIVFGVVVGTFGALLDLPSVVVELSPFEHAARLPLEPFAWAPTIGLSAVAAASMLLGLTGFRRRDLDGS